jgi:HEAT repeat protein
MKQQRTQEVKTMKKLRIFSALLVLFPLTDASLASTVRLQASAQGPARTVTQWLEQLKPKDANARTDAAKALGEMKDAGALDALVTALKDRNDEVRAQAPNPLARSRMPGQSTLSFAHYAKSPGWCKRRLLMRW